MPIKEQPEVGTEVCYHPAHFDEDEFENGIVKRVPKHRTDAVFVVYNCDGNWHKYQNYTAAMTRLQDLYLGWRTKNDA